MTDWFPCLDDVREEDTPLLSLSLTYYYYYTLLHATTTLLLLQRQPRPARTVSGELVPTTEKGSAESYLRTKRIKRKSAPRAG